MISIKGGPDLKHHLNDKAKSLGWSSNITLNDKAISKIYLKHHLNDKNTAMRGPQTSPE